MQGVFVLLLAGAFFVGMSSGELFPTGSEFDAWVEYPNSTCFSLSNVTLDISSIDAIACALTCNQSSVCDYFVLTPQPTPGFFNCFIETVDDGTEKVCDGTFALDSYVMSKPPSSCDGVCPCMTGITCVHGACVGGTPLADGATVPVYCDRVDEMRCTAGECTYAFPTVGWEVLKHKQCTKLEYPPYTKFDVVYVPPPVDPIKCAQLCEKNSSCDFVTVRYAPHEPLTSDKCYLVSGFLTSSPRIANDTLGPSCGIKDTFPANYSTLQRNNSACDSVSCAASYPCLANTAVCRYGKCFGTPINEGGVCGTFGVCTNGVCVISTTIGPSTSTAITTRTSTSTSTTTTSTSTSTITTPTTTKTTTPTTTRTTTTTTPTSTSTTTTTTTTTPTSTSTTTTAPACVGFIDPTTHNCTAYTVCVEGIEFQAKPPTNVSDRFCTLLRICTKANEYQTVAPTLTTDRVCGPYTRCSPTQFEAKAPTGTSDRVCNETTICRFGVTYQSVAATLTSDRVCTAVRVCNATQYQSVAPTATSNRVCLPISNCSGSDVELQAPTSTSDRVCGPYVPVGWVQKRGFCRYFGTRVGTQLSLRDCIARCESTFACESITRTPGTLGQCYFNVTGDRCAETLDAANNFAWEAWVRPDRCSPNPCAAGLTACQLPGICAHGACTPVNKPNGVSCDDSNPMTNVDTCQGGVCVGVLDTCLGVTCTSSNTCDLPGQCINGTGCVFPKKALNDPCDDGNSDTFPDKCTVGNICVGDDPCVNVVCTPSDACHSPEPCRGGQCLQVLLADGYPCSDFLNYTVNDTCTNGICSGRDVCRDTVCQPLDQCHVAGRCKFGVCSNPKKPDGVACDDADPRTTSDVCFQGTCLGVDLCDDVTCTPPTACHAPGVCFQGVCSYDSLPEDHVCDDGDLRTTDDKCISAQCVGTLIPWAVVDGVYCSVVGKVRATAVTADECQALCEADDACFAVSRESGDIGACFYAESDKCDDKAPDAEYEVRIRPELCLAQGIQCPPTASHCAVQTCLHGLCRLSFLPQHFSPCVPAGLDSKCVASSECSGEDECIILYKEPGAVCNDTNPVTDNDVCTPDHVCQGVDMCSDVNCSSVVLQPCVANVVCQAGECVNVFATPGVSCDDADPVTANDQCDANGVCRGVNLCANLDCQPAGQCFMPGCDQGVCLDIPAPRGTACNDNNPNTVSDVCDEQGNCAGVDPCVARNCVAQTPCQNVTCSKGICQFAVLRDGSRCNDGNPNTIGDTCSAGECRSTVGPCVRPPCECQFTRPLGDANGDCVFNATDATFVRSYISQPVDVTAYQLAAMDVDFDGQVTSYDADIFPSLVAGTVGFFNKSSLTAEQLSFSGNACRLRFTARFLRSNGTPFTATTAFIDVESVDSALRAQVLATTFINGSVLVANKGTGYNGQFWQMVPGSGAAAGQALVVVSSGLNVARLGVTVGQVGRDGTVILYRAGGSPSLFQDPLTVTGTLSGRAFALGLPFGYIPGKVVDYFACAAWTRIPESFCVEFGTRTPSGIFNVSLQDCIEYCAQAPFCSAISKEEVGPTRQCFVNSLEGSSCVLPSERKNFSNYAVYLKPDPCQLKACVPSGTCQTSVCVNGACVVGSVPDLTSCDDGNAATSYDVCRGGVCQGVDLCQGVTCVAQDMCHQVGTCSFGTCSNPMMPDGHVCDDSVTETVVDTCTQGKCVGLLADGSIPGPDFWSTSVGNVCSDFGDRSLPDADVTECQRRCLDKPYCPGVSRLPGDGPTPCFFATQRGSTCALTAAAGWNALRRPDALSFQTTLPTSPAPVTVVTTAAATTPAPTAAPSPPSPPPAWTYLPTQICLDSGREISPNISVDDCKTRCENEPQARCLAITVLRKAAGVPTQCYYNILAGQSSTCATDAGRTFHPSYDVYLRADPCANRVCPAPALCRDAGVCTLGVCSYALQPAGRACNDGLVGTVNDVCDVNGRCDGTACAAGFFQLAAPTNLNPRLCAPVTQCTSGQYQTQLPTATSDRVCTNLTRCRLSTQFESRAATATSDRVCSDLTVCNVPLQYSVVQATPTSDRRCGPVSPPCANGQFEAVAPTLYSDRKCVNYATCTPGVQFEAQAPTAQSDRACVDIRVCNPDTEYRTRVATPTSDAACSPLTVCAAATQFALVLPTLTSDRRCAALTVCNRLEYETRPATATSDRACAPRTTCRAGQQYERAAATATSNTDCQPLTRCGANAHEKVAPTATSDRLCAVNTVCVGEEFQTQPATSTSDRQCANYTECNLADGVYSVVVATPTSDRVCAPLRFCLPGVEFETVAPDAQRNRQCQALTPCLPGSGQFIFAPATPTSNQLCANITVCDPALEFQWQAATATSDRKCQMLTACKAGTEFETLAATPTSDRKCQALTVCSAGMVVVREATPTSNRVCSSKVPCNRPSGIYEVAPATPTSVRVCELIRTCDPVTQFETDAPTATSNRQCQDLTVCLPGYEYETVAATGYSDRRCRALTVCVAGTVEATAPTATSDRTCTSAVPCAAGLTYTVAAATATSARICSLLTVCAEGLEYETVAATATSDRSCTAARVCAPTEFETRALAATSDRLCQNLTVCGADTVEATAPTATGDRTCTSAVPCVAGLTYTVAAATATSVQVCQPLTMCVVGAQFESLSATATSDRVCAALRVCGPTEFETAPPTATTNRQCQALTVCSLAPLQYEAVPPTATSDRGCLAVQNCLATEFQTAAPTATSGRVCRALTVCRADAQFQATPPTLTQDRGCANATQCVPQVQYEAVPLGASSDRRCANVSAPCNFVTQFQAAAPTASSDRVCAPFSPCPAETTFVVKFGSATSDRVCVAQPTCVLGATYQVAGPTKTSARRCAAVLAACPAGVPELAAPTLLADRQCDYPTTTTTATSTSTTTTTPTSPTTTTTPPTTTTTKPPTTTTTPTTKPPTTTATTKPTTASTTSTTTTTATTSVVASMTLFNAPFPSGMIAAPVQVESQVVTVGACADFCVALGPTCVGFSYSLNFATCVLLGDLEYPVADGVLDFLYYQSKLASTTTFSTTTSTTPTTTTSTTTPTTTSTTTTTTPTTTTPMSTKTSTSTTKTTTTTTTPKPTSTSTTTTTTTTPKPTTTSTAAAAAASTVPPVVPPAQLFQFAPAARGSLALSNMLLPSSTVVYGVVDVAQCGQACAVDLTCVGFDHSPAECICVLLREALPTGPVPDAYGFLFYERVRVGDAAGVPAVDLLAISAPGAAGSGRNAQGCVDFNATLATTRAVAPAAQPAFSTGDFRLSVSFAQAANDAATFTYFASKSSADGATRSFAVGLTTPGPAQEVWYFYYPASRAASNAAGSSIVKVPLGRRVDDGAVHWLTVERCGLQLTVALDGAVLFAGETLELGAELPGSALPFFVGQRAPVGRLDTAFRGTICQLLLEAVCSAAPPAQPVVFDLEAYSGARTLTGPWATVPAAAAAAAASQGPSQSVVGKSFLSYFGSAAQAQLQPATVGREFALELPRTLALVLTGPALTGATVGTFAVSVRHLLGNTTRYVTLANDSGNPNNAALGTFAFPRGAAGAAGNVLITARGPTVADALVVTSVAASLAPTAADLASVDVLRQLGVALPAQFDGKSTAYTLPSLARTAAWSLVATVTQAAGNAGYLFAETGADTLKRYFGLYATPTSKTAWFFYETASGLQRADFPVQINDGAPHRVLLSVAGTDAWLTVDGARWYAALAGPILPCPDPVGVAGCRLVVGARASSAAVLGATLFFSGVMTELRWFGDTALAAAPGASMLSTATLPLTSTTTLTPGTGTGTGTGGAAAGPVDLLAVAGTALQGDAVRTGSGGVQLSGNGRVSLTAAGNANANVNVGGGLAFVFNVSFVQTAGTSGYLFGKFAADGVNRFFSLYSTPTQLQIFYRTAAGVNKILSFSAALSDGLPHVATVTVAGAQVSIVADGRVVGTGALAGLLDDCGAVTPTCLVYVGQRPPANVGFTGLITAATYTAPA